MSRLFPGWSIRQRLVFIIITIAVLTIVAVALIALNASATVLRRQTEESFVNTNQALANSLDSRLQEIVITTQSFANAMSYQVISPISQIWDLASNTLSDRQQLVRRVSIYTVDDTGHQAVIFNTPPSPQRVAPVKQYINNAIPGDTWFLQALTANRPRWNGPARAFDNSVLQDVLSYAVPFAGTGGRNNGIVWSDIPRANLERLLKETLDARGWQSYALLVTQDNQVAASYKVPDTMPGQTRWEILNQFLLQTNVMQARQKVTQQQGVFTLAPDPLDASRSSVILVSSLPSTGWQIITVLPANVLQNPLERSALQMAIVGLVGMIILGWFVHSFVGSTIAKPLEVLGTAAQEIGSGELRYQISYQEQPDEIGRLAKAMEEMKLNLSHSTKQLSVWSQSLEKRVEMRTGELEIARKVAMARANELEAVYEASLAVVGDYQLEIVLQKLTQNLLTLLKVSYCAVWLLTSDKKHLQLVATTSPNRRRLNTIASIDDGLIGQAVRDLELVVVDDYGAWAKSADKSISNNLERAMAAPLMFFKRPIGAVLVGRKTFDAPFSEQDQHLLTLFANLVSPVVRNAQLFIQREAANKEVERASSVKTRFLASVTHELRTPLNLIINNMDFMRIGMFGAVNDDQKNRLDQTVRSAEHLLSLINDLLDISKIEAGEMELMIQPADLHPVLEDALDSANMLIEGKHARLTLVSHVPENMPLIPMDARRIRQVLTNLLSNAVKFTTEGSITLEVNLLNQGIEFRVTDTGMGIAPEEMNNLFLSFERTDRAKNAGIEGTGLGLPISRFLVEAHGGQMHVESEVGKGSTFIFTLPYEVTPARRERHTQTMRAIVGAPGD